MLTKICQNCGKEFTKDYNRSVRDFNERARFCSNKCKVYKQEKFYKHWQGKRRPDLAGTEAARTMFKPKQIPWNKGTAVGTDPVKVKLTTYRATAKKRGYIFEVTLGQMREFLAGECAYCGEKPTGIDRVDNSLGYVEGNMVASCGVCNHMKWILSKDDFIAKCRQIAVRSKV